MSFDLTGVSGMSEWLRRGQLQRSMVAVPHSHARRMCLLACAGCRPAPLLQVPTCLLALVAGQLVLLEVPTCLLVLVAGQHVCLRFPPACLRWLQASMFV
jgi:hypothetical protein